MENPCFHGPSLCCCACSVAVPPPHSNPALRRLQRQSSLASRVRLQLFCLQSTLWKCSIFHRQRLLLLVCPAGQGQKSASIRPLNICSAKLHRTGRQLVEAEDSPGEHEVGT